MISVSGGIANSIGPTINERSNVESKKTYMGSIAITAPDSWGFMSGSTWYAGVVNGWSGSYEDTQTSWYLGGTLATPVTGLKLGASLDILDLHTHGETWSVAGYASYQATEKLSLHLRGEYLRDRGEQKSSALTSTVTGPTRTGLWRSPPPPSMTSGKTLSAAWNCVGSLPQRPGRMGRQ